jgi:hypothetical protein
MPEQIAVNDGVESVLNVPYPGLALLPGRVAAFLPRSDDPLGCRPCDGRRYGAIRPYGVFAQARRTIAGAIEHEKDFSSFRCNLQ